MFDSMDDGDEDKIRDQLLLGLIQKMEDIMGGNLRDQSGMGVEVQAADPEGLKAGLDKAGEVIDKGGPDLMGGDDTSDKGSSPEESDADDLARLKELLGEDDDEDKLKGR